MSANGSVTRQSLLRLSISLSGLVLVTACQSPYRADRGALLGGLTGAGVGAAIGDAKGNTAAGAALGTAVGALTGAAIGNEMDSMQAENKAMIQQGLAQRQASGATVQDAVTMTRAGLSDQVIIQHLRANGVVSAPSTADLITLKNEGVSDPVIQSMQELGASVIPVQYVEPAPVYVPEYYAYPYRPPYRWHRAHWHARHCRPGVSWGVSFRH